jgi:ferredoxin-thioredoxin reductase catalytic subunit/rubredoxin
MIDPLRIKARTDKLYRDLDNYKLNPDESFVESLAEGLLENFDRYGIESCPCRLFEGKKENNLDIVCPCIYRDDDLSEYGACFCALYVTEDGGNKQVPERRPSLEERQAQNQAAVPSNILFSLPYPVYRCSVCGYLMAAKNPPHICPICKAGKDRFETFIEKK